MSDVSLNATTGPPFDPEHPPARIYLQGKPYKLVSPHVAHPPVAGTVKCVMNWSTGTGQIAKNIFYLLTTPAGPTGNPPFLVDVANSLMTTLAPNATLSQLASVWGIDSITVHDNALGTGAVGTSTHARLPGTSSNSALPPQVAVCVSWVISASYRGGKPRWYLPGLNLGALVGAYGSAISPAVCLTIANAANNFLAQVNASTVDESQLTLGTISYMTGHSARPVPLFRPFVSARVHERCDSQRRRSGKESTFATAP